MISDVKKLIELYNFRPLPVENTLFTQSYKSEEGTAIIGLYCNEPYSISLFHKLPVDEIWHFYKGDPLRLILLYPDGSSKDVIMGTDVNKGEIIQFIVPAGVWQAGHMVDGGQYSLYGCTMAPGFTEEMFTGGTIEELLETYPDRQDDIKRYACEPGKTKM